MNILPVKFNIHPEPGSKKFYTVMILPNKKAMFRAYDSIAERLSRMCPYENVGHKFAAITIGFESLRVNSDGSEVVNNHIGYILFYRNFIGAGVVAHEMAHAGLFYIDRLHIGRENLEEYDIEERLCLVVGELNRKFWLQYHKKVAE